jgi:hypothetical protein
MPRNQDILDKFEKRLTGEQNDIRDFLVRLRWVTQLILTVLIPFGFTIVGRLVVWQKPFSTPIPFIAFLIFLAVQGLLVWANFKWTPRIDRFAELAKLRGMLLEVSRESRAHRNSSQAYGIALAALRPPLKPPEGTNLPPILNAEKGATKFKQLAGEIMAVFDQDKVCRFLGTGEIPEQFCASLYGMQGVTNGEAKYELIDRRSTQDYKRIRNKDEREARLWEFGEALLGPVSKHSKPYATDDLQEEPGVSEPKQRTYDGNLYRGAMFVRSNWNFLGDALEWDSSSEKPPAYLLIFTSGKVGAFKDKENNISSELLIEAVRDLLDTLLVVSYAPQMLQPSDSEPEAHSDV